MALLMAKTTIAGDGKWTNESTLGRDGQTHIRALSGLGKGLDSNTTAKVWMLCQDAGNSSTELSIAVRVTRFIGRPIPPPLDGSFVMQVDNLPLLEFPNVGPNGRWALYSHDLIRGMLFGMAIRATEPEFDPIIEQLRNGSTLIVRGTDGNNQTSQSENLTYRFSLAGSSRSIDEMLTACFKYNHIDRP